MAERGAEQRKKRGSEHRARVRERKRGPASTGPAACLASKARGTHASSHTPATPHPTPPPATAPFAPSLPQSLVNGNSTAADQIDAGAVAAYSVGYVCVPLLLAFPVVLAHGLYKDMDSSFV